LANDKEPEIENDISLNLIHAQDLAELLFDQMLTPVSGDIRPDGASTTVSDILTKLQRIAGQYNQGIIPDMTDGLTCRLFNTYRSYLFPEYYPRKLKLHEDNRGALFEAVKGHAGGQTFLSTTKSGITRGNHFHLKKMERFLVIRGEAKIRIRRLFDDTTHEFQVNGRTPGFIDIPTLHTHNITNTGDSELMTLFWSNEIFDPQNPDTFAELV